MKMTSCAEAAFESFADAAVIHQMIHAKASVPFQTMSSPHSNHSAKYFGAMPSVGMYLPDVIPMTISQ